MREKSKKLILFSELRKMIASGYSTIIIKLLDKIEEPKYSNEIIIHKKRINSLNQSKRIGLLTFSEFQLEETKIVNDILNLITEIESQYKRC